MPKMFKHLSRFAVTLLPLAAIGAPPAHDAAARAKRVKLCGWVVNPTPGNWSLIDRRCEWEIGTQGGYQAPGLDTIPDFSGKQWVATNGSYGYGCGCMTVDIDPGAKRITNIYSATQQRLTVCRADKKLPKAE